MKHITLIALTIFCFNYIKSEEIEISEYITTQINSAFPNENNSQFNRKKLSKNEHIHLSAVFKLAKNNWGKLNLETKALIGNFFDSHPQLEGTEKILDTDHYRIHYTTDGPDNEKINTADKNNNQIPDYIDKVAKIMEDDLHKKYHSQAGYMIPPSDSIGSQGDVKKHGGNAKYDIYVSNKICGNGVYGFVSPLADFSKNDQANYNAVVSASYMAIKSNFKSTNDYAVMRATLAHEYMHSIQFGYNAFYTAWFCEMFATWAEDFIYLNLGDNYQYLKSLLSTMDHPLNIRSKDNLNDGLRWYGTWLFARYMTEQTNDEIVKKIYDHNSKEVKEDYRKEIEGFNEVLAKHNRSFKKIYDDFLVSLILMSNKSKFSPYIFKHGDKYESFISRYQIKSNFLSSTFNLTNKDMPYNYDSNIDGNGKLYRLGSDFFSLGYTGNCNINLDNLGSDQIYMLVVKYNEDEIEVSRENSVSINNSDKWSGKYIIVVRDNFNATGDNSSAANSKQYKLRIWDLNAKDPSTSIAQNELESNIKIGPNPTSKLLNIYNIKIGSRCTIYNFLGKALMQKISNSTIETINLSTISKGNYLIKIESEGKTYIKQFRKN